MNTCGLIVMAGLAVAALAAEPLLLVDGGRSDYRIVIAKEVSPSTIPASSTTAGSRRAW